MQPVPAAAIFDSSTLRHANAMPPTDDLVQLTSEGLACPRGGFVIDPWKPADTAIITHAHGDHARTGSGLYHCTVDSEPLLRWRLGEDTNLVPHPYGEVFELGDTRVSLHPAGHILGSAQVRIDDGNDVWVASGDYKRNPDPTCPPFEVVPCDVFITEATFAFPIYHWCPTPQIAQQVWEWWQHCIELGDTAVLYCYALGKAQRLLAELTAFTDRRVLLHGAMTRAVDIYRAAGVHMLPTDTVSEQGKAADFAGELILAPPSAADSTWMRRFKNAQTGFASGWMQVRGNRRRRGYDRGFVLSDHADWPDLLRTIEETGAKRVLATHGNTDAIVQLLRERGVDAAPLRTAYGDEH